MFINNGDTNYPCGVFFFQAEDGIRDDLVTGVQTCALPIFDYLENVELAAPNAEARRLRLPVQWVSRPTPEQRRRYTGRLSGGTLSVGDEVEIGRASCRERV